MISTWLLAVALSPESPPPPAPDVDACDVEWTVAVIDADTTESVPEALVELQAEHETAATRARTDARGRAVFEGLCPGAARIVVSKNDHARRSVDVDLPHGPTTTQVELEPLHAHHSERVVIVHDDTPSEVFASDHIAGSGLARTRGEGLADAVAQVPGVTALRGTAGGMAKPVIRGQVGRRNLIVFDGVRHEGQKWGLDHAPEIDPYAAGRVTVIKGAATTRFGPDAIGGVVLVDPRPLLRAPGVAAEASTVGYSNALGGGGAARVDHAPARARGLAWRVDGDVARHRAALTPDYPLDNTGALTWNAGGRLGYLRERVDVVAGYRVLRTEAGICTCLRISTPEEFQDAIDSGRPIGVDAYSPEAAIERPRQEIWHHLAVLHSRFDLGRAGELHATYAYQLNDRSEYAIVRQNVTGPQLHFQLATHAADLRFEHARVDLGRGWGLVGTIGGGFTHQANDFEAATTLIPDYTQLRGGAFAVERFAGERVDIELGGRYDALDRTAALDDRDYQAQQASGRLDEAACTPDGSGGGSGGGSCRQRFHAPSGTLGVVARPFARAEGLAMRMTLDSSARIPAIDEQFMNGSAPSFPVLGVGDSHLGIERTWGATMALVYAGHWLRAEGDAYTSYVDDYIYFRPSPQTGQCAPLTCTSRGPMPVFAFEARDALFGGGEVRVDLVAPRLPFAVSGNGAWVRGFDLARGVDLSFVPANRYELTGRYLWPDTRVSSTGYLELSGTVVDRQRHYDPEADFSAPPSAYVLLGAGAGVEFPGPQTLMRLSLRGTNLLNQRYREYTSLLRYFADEPGWGVQLRFSIEFSAGLERKDAARVSPS